MDISVFDLFSIGIGPSSSHTVGPMRAAQLFIQQLLAGHHLEKVKRINVELFGSLAFTGKGHGTDKAIALGLEGYKPESIDPLYLQSRFTEIANTKQLSLNQSNTIAFDPTLHFIYHLDALLPLHSNGMRFSAFAENGALLHLHVYYSIGGGFVIDDQPPIATHSPMPYLYETAKELLTLCETQHCSISDIVLANERTRRSDAEITARLDLIISTMQKAIDNSCHTGGVLPGHLKVPRRAARLYEQLFKKGKPESYNTMDSMDWLNLYAIAVNEANAAGDRVVTAPTNGAAGIIPAVLTYYEHFYPDATREKLHAFLLTAGAIAILYKKRASISGAEVGCQGEVGVACSMAAGALTAVLGGTLSQIENAAEIAMEHHLGMTCDPIGGLVQIPCIERNAMGAVKAVNATRLALMGDGTHFVSLDDVIRTMKQTGEDMKSSYKETSQAGLAVNVVDC